jgi:hypothetical protein
MLLNRAVACLTVSTASAAFNAAELPTRAYPVNPPDGANGTRSGGQTALMKQVVANMTTEDMIAVAAYAASQQP